MKGRIFTLGSTLLLSLLSLLAVAAGAHQAPIAPAASAAGWTVVAWNNLGMHCMDADFAVFSLLPPYNTIHAQVIDATGRRVIDPAADGITVTYEAVNDPSGSINKSSIGKTNFWAFAQPLYGASPAPDVGLAGYGMPGAANAPRAMAWDAAMQWFIAEGIPITPFDDAGGKNPYPMMRIVVRANVGGVLASTDIVLPVSDEMDCRACHASNAGPAARPAAGWVNDPDVQRDFRLNILRIHDEKQAAVPAYAGALAAMGYDAAGLFATASAGKPVLCAACHASNALPGTGLQGIPPLTSAIHALHAAVHDPLTGLTLQSADNRSACYRCHPGSTTRCLRGAMGRAVAPDGTMLMQCQSCHGGMVEVGKQSRIGWLDEPSCQNCHTGTAMHNSGQIRYTSAFDSQGVRRIAVDGIFATNADVPVPGFSLFRFSTGHGGLACEACHGSTHAESPSTHAADNIQAELIQGYAGALGECSACHATVPSSVNGGPHGMHPVGQAWVSRHPDLVEQTGSGACRNCHGADYRGSVLSCVRRDRTLTAFGTRNFWAGFMVGCYGCHKGPGSDSANPNHAPKVVNAHAATAQDQPVTLALSATDSDRDPLTLRVVSQPQHGTVGLSGATATYTPEASYSGQDSFTFAAWDGQTDSNLGLGTIAVGGAPLPPQVIGVKRLSRPFRLVVTGDHFDPNLQVFIDGAPWTNVQVKSVMRVALKQGNALGALFPADTFVPVKLVNPATGLAATFEYNRTGNQWHNVP